MRENETAPLWIYPVVGFFALGLALGLWQFYINFTAISTAVCFMLMTLAVLGAVGWAVLAVADWLEPHFRDIYFYMEFGETRKAYRRRTENE